MVLICQFAERLVDRHVYTVGSSTSGTEGLCHNVGF